MRRRFVVFAIDVGRMSPLVAVSMALAVNVLNLVHVLNGQLSAEVALERFAFAFVAALAAVNAISRMLVRYAYQSLQRHGEDGEAPAETPVPLGSNGTSNAP